MIAQLDRELGYNFLKKIKVSMEEGIFQMFESKEANKILLLSNLGNFYEFDFFEEKLRTIIKNPN